MEFAAFLQPPLTTIRVERREIGRLAVCRLLDRLTNPGLIPIRIEVQTRLIERQSVATITPALREA
jgi:LacI family transcriptional regulator